MEVNVGVSLRVRDCVCVCCKAPVSWRVCECLRVFVARVSFDFHEKELKTERFVNVSVLERMCG